MKKHLTIMVATITSALCSSVYAQRPELGNIVYTYAKCPVKGSTLKAGMPKVNVMRFGPKEDKAFLVQVLGIDHALNGKAIIYRANDLQSTKLQYSLLNEQDGKVVSSMIFDGGDEQARLFIKGFSGLNGPLGGSSQPHFQKVCLTDYSLDPYQYYRRYESQQAKR